MSFDVVVVGSVNVDVAARGEALPGPGETREADELIEGFGGKGANQAVAAAKLGARVAIVGRVGDDRRGEACLDNLQAAGIDTTYVRTTDGANTGVAVIHVSRDGQKSIFAVAGANARLTGDDVERAAAHLGAPRVVLAQLEIPDAAVLAAARLAHACGGRFLLDPAPPRDLDEELWRLVDVVKPNAREAEALTGIEVVDRASATRAARALVARGARAVTIGSPEGNHLVTKEDDVFFARKAVEAVDATGAGDAFLGALAVMLAEGRGLEDAARFANAAAALKTTKKGAQSLPTRAEIEECL